MLPACGFVIAVALIGITSAFKDAPKNGNGREMYVFEYNPPESDPEPYSVANVQDVSHWTSTTDATPCTNTNFKACKIYASAGNVDASGSEPVLLSSEAISATLNTTTNSAYVSSTDDGSLSNPSTSENISNRNN